MSARSVQISLDEQLLDEIDNHPEVQRGGRSAFIRRALKVYLRLGTRMKIDQAYASGYGDEVAEVDDEFADLMDSQAWIEE